MNVGLILNFEPVLLNDTNLNCFNLTDKNNLTFLISNTEISFEFFHTNEWMLVEIRMYYEWLKVALRSTLQVLLNILLY